ncbi:uncharacterized protein LOC143859297 [Tasmannia lanceolata]|uniref:uncharacterized protein LOC143859297 n=1 Tax=Tasmannia lanceolata TaxID=3420 RepID=UPI0040638550
MEKKKSEEASSGERKEERSEEGRSGEKRNKRIMVAIDESEGSFYALRWALDNLFCYGYKTKEEEEEQVCVEKTLTILHVQQPFQHYMFPAGPAVYATSAVVDSVRKSQEQNSALLLSRALEMCKGKPIKVESVIVDGEPKDMICEVAERIHADLVVVGSRGLSKIKRAFLGSVSDYCAHHASCPILIVKPRK